jgi:hypothetical protein
MKRLDDSHAVRLPNEVVELMNTKGIPKTAVAIRRSEGADMPLTTYGLRAAVERMNAESDLYDATTRLEGKRGEMVIIEDLRTKVTQLEAENRQLRDDKEKLLREVERQTAARAMAVSGEGSQR